MLFLWPFPRLNISPYKISSKWIQSYRFVKNKQTFVLYFLDCDSDRIGFALTLWVWISIGKSKDFLSNSTTYGWSQIRRMSNRLLFIKISFFVSRYPINLVQPYLMSEQNNKPQNGTEKKHKLLVKSKQIQRFDDIESLKILHGSLRQNPSWISNTLPPINYPFMTFIQGLLDPCL